jgi:hypothetical protein
MTSRQHFAISDKLGFSHLSPYFLMSGCVEKAYIPYTYRVSPTC